MSEPVRQLDVPLRGKRPANAPIPGSARERVQKQAERMLPGIGTPQVEAKPHPVAKAWGDAASQGGFALALSLRSKAFKRLMRVLCAVLWFTLPTGLSMALTLVLMVWALFGVRAWVVRLSRKRKGVAPCQCKC
jgi:hypothetical protein